MPIGSLIGAGVSIFNGIKQRNDAKKAAEQQAKAREAGITRLDDAARTGMLGVTDAGRTAGAGVTDAGALAAAGVTGAATAGRDRILGTLDAYQPYQTAGSTAAQQSAALTSAPVNQFSFDPSSLGMDPGYLFRQKEANKAALANGAAFGDLQSGGFAKAFQDRNQEAASQETDKVYGRQLQTFNTNQTQNNSRISQLAQLMGFGLNANNAVTDATGDASRLEYQGASDAGGFGTDAAAKAGMFGADAARQSALLGQNAAQGGADLLVGAGDARAVGTVNASNAITGMLGNVAKGIDWGNIFKKSTWRTGGGDKQEAAYV